LALSLAEAPDSSWVSSKNFLSSIIQGATPIDSIASGGLAVKAEDTSFFQIGKCTIRQVVSNHPIIGFNKKLVNGLLPVNGIPILRSFSSDIKKYEDVSYIISEVVATSADIDASDLTFPHLKLKAKTEIQENGISGLCPIPIPLSAVKEIAWEDLNGEVSGTIGLSELSSILDRDRTTAMTISSSTLTGGHYGYKLSFKIDMTALVDTNVDKAYFCIDFKAHEVLGPVSLNFGIGFRLYDQYGREIDTGESGSGYHLLTDPNGNNIVLTDNQKTNLLPADYYCAGGDSNGEDDRFHIATYNSTGNGYAFSELDLKKILMLVKNGVADPNFYIDIVYVQSAVSPIYALSLGLSIYEIGFVAERVISTENKALYPEVAGETIGNDGATETNNVHAAIRHILEDYDKIPSALIDYGNLSTTRGIDASYPWYLGRQLQERKNSLDYLQEICKQSFIGYFMSRSGKHTFSSWIDNTTTSVVHDKSIIIRGSISNWDKTDLAVVYNDFNIQYNQNPGLNKLDRSLVVTNISAAAFPVITVLDTDDVPLWEKYSNFPGIPKAPISFNPTAVLPTNPEIGDSYLATATANGWITGHYYAYSGSAWSDGGTAASPSGWGYPYAYAMAKTLWDGCNASYKKNFVIQQPGDDLSKLEYYPDRSILSDLTKAAQGINDHSSPFIYLQYLIYWCTIQKYLVQYQIPINSTNATLDMLQPIKFADKIYTNDVQRQGWIVRISPNPSADVFDVKLILAPF
jgi:hypothetical protein